MNVDDLPAHSPLGASGAERWMNCPGSISLLKRLDIPEESDEPDYRREGIALHEAAAECLARGIDAWEIVGETFHETVLDTAMCDAIQVYLDRVRPSMGDAPGKTTFHGKDFFIETKLAVPEVHPSMFGSVDFGAMAHLYPPHPPHGHRYFLDVTDLKGGVGIVVEVVENPQIKYYAFMLLSVHFKDAPDDLPVRLTIVQPRAFHHDGPVREWWTTAGHIRAWAKDELVPAMLATEMDGDLDAGPWCRFCPAKLVCPLLKGLFKAACTTDPKLVVTLTDEGLDLEYRQLQAVKFYQKAVEDETFRRLQLGQAFQNAKLVNKKANRVFNDTIDGRPLAEVLTEKFGKDAFTAPEVRSPAELEKVSPAAKKFVKEWAYTPNTGLTVALMDDPRVAVKAERPAVVFAEAAKQALQGEER